MGIEVCISGTELRKALAELEEAEKNGFEHCLAVFRLATTGHNLHECRAVYSDLLERGHPTGGSLNWGRFQGVTKTHRLVKGKLVPLKKKVREEKAKTAAKALETQREFDKVRAGEKFWWRY